MTFDEIGGLWCELWQREQGRGNKPTAEGNGAHGTFWIQMTIGEWVQMTYRLGMSYDGAYSVLEYYDGRDFSFNIIYEPDGTISRYIQGAPANLWEEAAAAMRALLGDEHETGGA